MEGRGSDRRARTCAHHPTQSGRRRRSPGRNPMGDTGARGLLVGSMTPRRPQAPSPEAQVAFLQNLQRILDEGSFVATYKFALIHALADLSVERGDDSSAALTLPTRDIADRFVQLYWRQVVPFPGAGQAGLLLQNTGHQAAIVNRVAEARVHYGDSGCGVRGSGRMAPACGGCGPTSFVSCPSGASNLWAPRSRRFLIQAGRGRPTRSRCCLGRGVFGPSTPWSGPRGGSMVPLRASDQSRTC